MSETSTTSKRRAAGDTPFPIVAARVKAGALRRGTHRNALTPVECDLRAVRTMDGPAAQVIAESGLESKCRYPPPLPAHQTRQICRRWTSWRDLPDLPS